MSRYTICLLGFIVSYSLPLAAKVDHRVAMTTDSIAVRSLFDTSCGQSSASMAERYYAALAKAFGLHSMEVIIADVGETSAQPVDAVFMRSANQQIREVLLQFERQTKACKEPCRQTVSIKLHPDIELYSHVRDVLLHPAYFQDIQLQVSIKDSTDTCEIKSKIEFDNLFFFDWLQRAYHIFSLPVAPSVHQTLQYLSSRLSLIAHDVVNVAWAEH